MPLNLCSFTDRLPPDTGLFYIRHFCNHLGCSRCNKQKLIFTTILKIICIHSYLVKLYWIKAVECCWFQYLLLPEIKKLIFIQSRIIMAVLNWSKQARGFRYLYPLLPGQCSKHYLVTGNFAAINCTLLRWIGLCENILFFTFFKFSRNIKFLKHQGKWISYIFQVILNF